MILAAALLMIGQTAAPPEPAPESQEDIVIVARRMDRLKRLRMTTTRDPATGVNRCVFQRRSGDPALDTIVCDAVLACTPTMHTMDEMRRCIAPTIDPLLAKGARWQAVAKIDGR